MEKNIKLENLNLQSIYKYKNKIDQEKSSKLIDLDNLERMELTKNNVSSSFESLYLENQTLNVLSNIETNNIATKGNREIKRNKPN